ncbi:MAG: Rieske 2Fe-2S domain-containing protein [Hyphomicrobiales bacterium]|nr:Rieske 2Fe-2S domain-containing protein [Hyphomicrobiales bacterium]
MDTKVDQRPADVGAAKDLVKPYSGYEKNHVPAHDPLLTETGPGTPMGEYMRRFWHPVCMSEELTDTPHYLEFLGEELVAFRDKSGRVGLLHAHCCHRGASLEYGMIQEKGIMCSYHGWVYDVDGTCLDVPLPKGEEEEAEKFKATVCQGAYKAFEQNGLVFAYMGPAEEEPPFPNWEEDFSVHPDDELVPFSNFQHCNWLQVQDNAADQYHHIPLHTTAVVEGHEQGTTFGEAGAAPYLVRPDLQFFPVHNGTGMAWTSSRRVDDEKLFVRINHQALPNLSFHSYLFEDGSEKKHFSRVHMIRWTVPVDDTNSKMIGWRVIGRNIDPRDIGKKHLVGYESMDFLEGQVAMRRPEREKYGQGKLPPIPKNHRERPTYKDAQYAPGDYEVIITQRPIAVHALEKPMKADGGVYLFRKLLRDAVTGSNKKAEPEAIRAWLQETNATPNSYCSGHVLEVPTGATQEEEVARRRDVARQVIDALNEADTLKGKERTDFVLGKLTEIEKANSH